MFPVLWHRHSVLIIQCEMQWISPTFCCTSSCTPWDRCHCAWHSGEDHLPSGLFLAEIHTTWKCRLALNEKPDVPVAVRKARQSVQSNHNWRTSLGHKILHSKPCHLTHVHLNPLGLGVCLLHISCKDLEPLI